MRNVQLKYPGGISKGKYPGEMSLRNVQCKCLGGNVRGMLRRNIHGKCLREMSREKYPGGNVQGEVPCRGKCPGRSTQGKCLRRGIQEKMSREKYSEGDVQEEVSRGKCPGGDIKRNCPGGISRGNVHGNWPGEYPDKIFRESVQRKYPREGNTLEPYLRVI